MLASYKLNSEMALEKKQLLIMMQGITGLSTSPKASKTHAFKLSSNLRLQNLHQNILKTKSTHYARLHISE